MGQARTCQCCSTLSPLRVFDADAAQSYVRHRRDLAVRHGISEGRQSTQSRPLGAGTKWQNLSTTASGGNPSLDRDSPSNP
jgi:hypothetical protein